MRFLDHARAFDGVILDVWGVLHDGRRPYPDAAAALSMLQQHRVPTLLVSNAPWRAESVLQSLRDLGLDTDGLVGALTAGDVARAYLRTQAAQGIRHLWMVGSEHHLPLLEGLDLTLVDSPDEAEMVMLAHPAPIAEGAMDRALERGLPMLCANPDLRVVHQDGDTTWCAGRLAQAYEHAGGAVHYAGKPEAEIYRVALERLDLQPARALAVGDTPETDLLGAANAGIAALWVARRGETSQDPRLETLPTQPRGLVTRLD